MVVVEEIGSMNHEEVRLTEYDANKSHSLGSERVNAYKTATFLYMACV